MRLSVGQKLIGGFLAVALLALLLGIFAIVELNKVNSATKDMGENWLVATSYAGQMRSAAPDMHRSILRHLLETNPTEVAGIESRLGNYTDKFEKNLGLYEPSITSDSERALFNEIKTAFGDYKASVAEDLALSRAGKKAAAYRQMSDKTYPIFNHLNEKVEALVDLNLTGGAAAMKRSEQDFRMGMGVTVGVVLAVVILALALGMFISRQITRNVSAMAKAAEGIANGDLDQHVEVTTHDELGDMAASFRKMIENLSRIIGEVRDSASTVAAGADQISAGTEQLSQSAQAQAA
ncbi:MAG TPA: methyl-accepting chemotaxis protein, partial [Stenomitos sp.]